MSASGRFSMLFDHRRFARVPVPPVAEDPLGFKDHKRYRDRLAQYRDQTGMDDAACVASGKIGGVDSIVFVLDFEFMGGSMGVFVGEAFLAAAKAAVKKKAPLVAVVSSGGARMQEGILSLMQMSRTTLGVNMVRDARLPYIVVMANPTMGGVSASFAMLGDVGIAENGATIGFAGRRVIEQATHHKLPPEFQTAEYLSMIGGVDFVVHRAALKDALSNVIRILTNKKG
jgi:acetyl-CoA carboxylase carboxyl transferase subunit beta